MAVEEEFGLEDMDEEDLSGISTVADLVLLPQVQAGGLKKSKETGAPPPGGAPA